MRVLGLDHTAHGSRDPRKWGGGHWGPAGHWGAGPWAAAASSSWLLSLSLPSFCSVSLLSLPFWATLSHQLLLSLGPPGLPAPSRAPATPHPFPGVRRLCQPSRLFGIV